MSRSGFSNLPYHSSRLNNTRKHALGLEDRIDLVDVLSIPDWLGEGRYKCRIVYADEIISIEYQPYTPRKVTSLKLVQADDLEYSFKYVDRSKLNCLLESRDGCDDILIVQNNMLTDTSYTNIGLFDGSRWVTPSTFLLPGTKRQCLIDTGVVEEMAVSVEDIFYYKKLCLINSMLDFAEIVLPVRNIKL